MTTLFYQLICEVSSKDQEGARKMEVGDIVLTLVPRLNKVSETIIPLLELEKNSLHFVDLQHPVIREVDKIWANELFGEDADSILFKARMLLEFLATQRNS